MWNFILIWLLIYLLKYLFGCFSRETENKNFAPKLAYQKQFLSTLQPSFFSSTEYKCKIFTTEIESEVTDLSKQELYFDLNSFV